MTGELGRVQAFLQGWIVHVDQALLDQFQQSAAPSLGLSQRTPRLRQVLAAVDVGLRAAPRVRDEVLALRPPALLTRPGLLARYDLVPMLEALAQTSSTAGGPPSLWLLVPQDGTGRPRIDDAVLGVISGANWAHLTQSWLQNAHRAGGRAA